MTMELNSGITEYRVLLVDPVSRRVLGHAEGSGFRVLRASIPKGARLVRQLRTELLRTQGVRVVILDFLSGSESSVPCVIAELLPSESSVDFPAVRPHEISNEDLSEYERARLLAVLRNEVADPFSRLGWIEEAIAWVEEMTGRRLCSKHGIEQHNAGGTSALLHLSMEDGRRYWLKATAAPQTHERRLTRLLATLCPRSLPRIVAEKPEWNAWLMTEEASCLTSLPTNEKDLVRVLGQAVQSLAELQIETVGHESSLFDAGAFDQRLHVMQANAEMLFSHIDEAMSLQTSTKVSRIETIRLQEMRKLVEDACEHVERLDIPSTILHGDMNLGNLVFTENRCQFIDWCEGYVGHPLVSFQHLLLLNPIENSTVRARVNEALREIYRTAMRAVCDLKHITEGFGYMELLAAASALYGREDWLHSDLRNDSQRLAYVRCIARHMDRSARETGLLEALRV